MVTIAITSSAVRTVMLAAPASCGASASGPDAAGGAALRNAAPPGTWDPMERRLLAGDGGRSDLFDQLPVAGELRRVEAAEVVPRNPFGAVEPVIDAELLPLLRVVEGLRRG